MDLGEHRLRDLGHREHLFQVNRDGLPRDFPPAEIDRRISSRSAASDDLFVGRDEDMALVVKRWACSVVTLTGVGMASGSAPCCSGRSRAASQGFAMVLGSVSSVR